MAKTNKLTLRLVCQPSNNEVISKLADRDIKSTISKIKMAAKNLPVFENNKTLSKRTLGCLLFKAESTVSP